jgi:catalase
VLEAIGNGTIGEFLEKNPSAKAFVDDPKPFPVSFATEKFFAVNAFKFVSKDGKETFIRYRVVPVAGFAALSESDMASKSKTYLFDELEEHLSKEPFEFKLLAQIAEEGDVTDDNTQHWPESRKQVELGAIKIEKVLDYEESLNEQKQIIYDPIPRVEGIEPSEDPLLDVRAALYLISGRIRRKAEGVPEVPDAAVA